MARSKMTPEVEKAYLISLEKAVTVGFEVLEKGGSALDAVQAAVITLEDNELFNAGKGAVFSAAKQNELDASIMDGTGKAGAVSGVLHIKNPITLARAVMEKSGHVMLSGEGAEAFAKEQGFEFVPQSYFYTDRQMKRLQRQQKSLDMSKSSKMGTVGAVALEEVP